MNYKVIKNKKENPLKKKKKKEGKNHNWQGIRYRLEDCQDCCMYCAETGLSRGDELSSWGWASRGCICVFFFSFRITCLGITSKTKLPPFQTAAETFRIWKITDSSYDKKMGTVSATVATVNRAWKAIYINKRFWSPSKPLKRHHKLFAFWAFFESSL